MRTPVFSKDSTESEINMFISLAEKGDILKVVGNYEDVVMHINRNAEKMSRTFKIVPITPGTSLYTLYGANHLVVVANEPNK